MENTREEFIRLSDVEEKLREMAYNGGPWTYYFVLHALQELPRKSDPLATTS